MEVIIRMNDSVRLSEYFFDSNIIMPRRKEIIDINLNHFLPWTNSSLAIQAMRNPMGKARIINRIIKTSVIILIINL